jgi:hypothetical protein
MHTLLSLFALTIFGLSCNNKIIPADGVLKGKLVISEICSHYVVQVTSGKLDTAYVTNGWADEKRNKTYDNVFTVGNRCGFAKAGLKEGDEFEFSFDKNPAPEDCLVCMAFYPTPPKRNVIRITTTTK